MITKIITENQTQIQEAIRTNGQGAITGDILQEKMLLLNRDLFGGQIEYDTHLLLEDVERAVVNMRLRTDSDLFNFVKEWYNSQDWYVESTWQNNYIALYGGRNNAYIVGYMRLCFKSNWVGEEGILCYLLGCDSNLLKFVVSPESSDMEDNYISPEDVEYRSLPTILDMNLPWEGEAYGSESEMLAALGITFAQLEGLFNGQYIYVRQTNGNEKPLYSIQRITKRDVNGRRTVVVGDSIQNYETTAWELDFDDYRINYVEI